MQKCLHILFTLTATIVLAACSSGSGRSLLALEDEKAEIRAALAKKIGTTPVEIQQALDTTQEQERRTAAAVTQRLKTRVGSSSDIAMGRHLQAMTNRLAVAIHAEDENFKIVLLKSRQANAFTPGAGTILVTEGLLQFAQNEAQVAAVVAHEMAHALMKHPQRQKQIKLASKAGGRFMDAYTPESLTDSLGRMLRIGGSATMNGMIRQQELMADSIGIDILVKAGYDPRQLVTLLHALRLQVPQGDRLTNVVYGNHPMTIDRETAAASKINKLYQAVAGDISSQKFDALVEPYHKMRARKLAQSQ